MSGQTIEVTPDREGSGDLKLFEARPKVRVARSFPNQPPGPAVATLQALAAGQGPSADDRTAADALRDLVTLGAISIGGKGEIAIADGLVRDGVLSRHRLRELLSVLPGCADAMTLLERDPTATPAVVGEIIRNAYGVEWAPATVVSSGKHMRAWARHAGIATRQKRSGPRSTRYTEPD